MRTMDVARMHRAAKLQNDGATIKATARAVGVAEGTVKRWRKRPEWQGPKSLGKIPAPKQLPSPPPPDDFAMEFANAQTAAGQAILGEMGISGLRIVTGIVNEEYHTTLDDVPDRIDAYMEMRNTAEGSTMEKLVSLPIRRATWTVECEEGSGQEDMCETIQENLLNGMTQTWDGFVREALLGVLYGFSVHEKVWEEKDGLLQIRKLPGRHPKTHDGWMFDETGGLAGWKQYGYSTANTSEIRTVEIPIEKLLVFTFDGEYGNPEGRGALRPAYGYFYAIKQLLKLACIRAEREAVGVPTAQVKEGVTELTEDERDAMLAVLNRIRGSQDGGIVIPKNIELGAFELGHADTPFLPLIQHLSRLHLQCFLMEFVALGQESVGSYALHDDKSNLFLLGLEAVADWFASCVDSYLIKQYVDYNWGPQRVYPGLKHAGVGAKDKGAYADIIAQLFSPTMDLGRLPEIDEAVRELFDLPERPEGAELDETRRPQPKIVAPKDDEDAAEASFDVDEALLFASGAGPQEETFSKAMKATVERLVTRYMAKLTPLAEQKRYSVMGQVTVPLIPTVKALTASYLNEQAHLAKEKLEEEGAEKVVLGREASSWISAMSGLFANRLAGNIQWGVVPQLIGALRGGAPIETSLGNMEKHLFASVSSSLDTLPQLAELLVDELQG